jgi:hypothetical protein
MMKTAVALDAADDLDRAEVIAEYLNVAPARVPAPVVGTCPLRENGGHRGLITTANGAGDYGCIRKL